jgi:hypothetical protein
MKHDENTDMEDLFMACVIILGLIGSTTILIMSIKLFAQANGYGGSPGHMSPMEVEELYEKNHK